MLKFGKTKIYAIGMIFIGLGNIVISLLQDLSPSGAIAASFISHSLSGSGFAFTVVV